MGSATSVKFPEKASDTLFTNTCIKFNALTCDVTPHESHTATIQDHGQFHAGNIKFMISF